MEMDLSMVGKRIKEIRISQGLSQVSLASALKCDPCYVSKLETYVPVEVTQSVSIVMVGDMLMHLNVTKSGFKDDGTKNYDHLFERIKPDLPVI